MLSAGLRLADRYLLADRIAAGGAGEVWRGTDTVLARPVAVKLLRAEYAEHPQTLARFRAEARHAGAVSHAGVAHVYDYVEAGPAHPPFLVMELVDGPSLAVVLAGGPLDPARAMDVVAQAAAGLHAAHLAGLVHRDVKPGNLLLSPGGQVKITDFGIAYAAGSAQVTSAGVLAGTPAYLAPERVSGGRATPASDLYSLGVVAYECLAGTPPFSGTPVEVAVAHRDRPVPPLPATVPQDVATLVTELTAKDPAARPGSAGEVARRAGQLSDRMSGGATGQLGTRLGPPPATLVDVPVPGAAPARRWPWGRGRLSRRAAALAAATVVAAGLLGLLLASVLGAVPPGPATLPSGTPRPGAGAAANMVEVNADTLTGQPVGAVRQQLSQLGLVVRVLWQPSGKQPPGTVLAVRPSGWLPRGSQITVTGALQPNGHGHRHDNGGGD